MVNGHAFTQPTTQRTLRLNKGAAMQGCDPLIGSKIELLIQNAPQYFSPEEHVNKPIGR